MAWYMEPNPPSESEWIAREEEIERFEVSRARELDARIEYRNPLHIIFEGNEEYDEANWVEMPEFIGKRPPAVARMQMGLFEEVA